MTTSTSARARKAWGRQFALLYAIALLFTLVPFLAAAGPVRDLLGGLPSGELGKALDLAYDALIHDRLDEAIAATDEALALDADSERARAIRANALIERWWVGQAEADLVGAREQVALLEGSDDAQAHVARGNLLLAQEDPAGAVKALRLAVEADPEDAYAHHQLGYALNAAGSAEEAVGEFQRALQLAPQMAWVQSNLLGAMVALGRCDMDVEGLLPGVAGSCHNQLGVQRYEAEAYGEAGRHFLSAVEAAPDSGLFHVNLAAALVGTGDFGGAAEHARHARDLGHEDHWVFETLGVR